MQYLFLLPFLLSLVYGLQILEKGVVKLDIARRFHQDLKITKRDGQGTVRTSVAQGNQSFYEAEVALGTPPQKFKLLVDTGSSDTWVHDILFENNPTIANYGTYSFNASSTAKKLNTNFSATYNDGTTDSGYYITDKLTIGDTSKSADKFQFAVVTEAVDNIGILGLGPAANENTTILYNNLPLYLWKEGIINKPIFSLSMNEAGDFGSVIFGKTDPTQFSTGTLVSHPLGIVNGTYTHYAVGLAGIYQEERGIQFDTTYANFDTGYSTIQFPSQIFDLVGKLLNATYFQALDRYIYDCNNQSTLTVGFDSQNLTIPLSNLVSETIVLNDVQQCMLGISRNGKNQFVFGDMFFKNIYTVFDVDLKTVSFAQSKYVTVDTQVNDDPTNGQSAGPDDVTTTLLPSATSSSAASGTAAAAQSSDDSSTSTHPWTVYNGNLSSFGVHGSTDWASKTVKKAADFLSKVVDFTLSSLL